MINFNQDLAWQFYEVLHTDADDVCKVEGAYHSVVASSGAVSVDKAIKNCQCNSADYNSKDAVTDRIWHVLHAMPTASTNELFGYLIPEFFCLGEKALHLVKNDGKVSCESVNESPKKNSRRS